MNKIFAMILAAGLALPVSATADTWVLDGAQSRVAFGSIKKNRVGEVHSFTGLSGQVNEDGTAVIDIDLASVETNIDIRNARMIEHVFKGIAQATIAAKFDFAEVEDMAVGDARTIYAEATISFVGADVWTDTDLFVVRLSETQVMVTTADMIFFSTEEAGVDAGIDKLKALAELPGITRTAPVTLRLMFNLSEDQA